MVLGSKKEVGASVHDCTSTEDSEENRLSMGTDCGGSLCLGDNSVLGPDRFGFGSPACITRKRLKQVRTLCLVLGGSIFSCL
jgi:hypothetical protein